MWRRSGVAVAAGGQRVFVLIDAQEGGLFRSDDSGQTWTRTSADTRLTSRGWYFSGITVDPGNPDLVYVPSVALYRSRDGGKTFTVLKGAPGGDDYHILWVDPGTPSRMILGSDQGTNVSLNSGATWSTWYNQPTAQMYHAIVDNQFPYAVYGAQQDSGTAAVMSRTGHGSIDARDWFSVGGGEAGYIAQDPRNPNILYVGDTSGSLSRFDRRTAQAQNITPWPMPSGGPQSSISTRKYRFPWTAPLVFSPTDPATLYYGSQYLLKTTDGGLSWKEISPDLTGDTRKDKTAPAGPATPENARALGYGVIYSIGPSPLKTGPIWVGSDTGLIHVTRDAGAHWENVTPQGLPDWSRVTQIEASHFDPAVAYAAVDRHRMEDYKPYLYRTRDYGKTWSLLTDGLSEPAYLNSIREDPARKGLLYAATELGVSVSFDDGGHWQSLQLNLPTVSVRDVVVHGDDLAIATFGRGFWILDNASPLRQIDDRAISSDAFLFKPAAAIRMNPEPFMGTPFPIEEPKAKNPPDGAMVDYYFKSAPAGEVVLEVLDGKNQVIRRYSSQQREEAPPRRPGAIADYWIEEPLRLTAAAGAHRFVWDLRYAAPRAEPPGENDFDGPPKGPQVLPGTYQLRLTAGGRSYTQPLVVKLDPRSTATAVDLTKQSELSLSCVREMGKAADALREIRESRRRLAERRPSAKADLASKIAALDAEAARLIEGGDGGRRGNNLISVSSQLSAALAVTESADRTPPEDAYTLFGLATRELSAELSAWKALQSRITELLKP
jgi:photosystem II stability/assembly factor-like uncharacterized protein